MSKAPTDIIGSDLGRCEEIIGDADFPLERCLNQRIDGSSHCKDHTPADLLEELKRRPSLEVLSPPAQSVPETAQEALEIAIHGDSTTPRPASKPKKLCPECGGEVGPKTKGVAKIFCSSKCRSKFHARSKARGQVLVPLLLAWRVGRGSTETSKAAHAEMIQITDRFAQEDRAAGRPPIGDYVSKLLWMGRHVDRRRK